MMAITERETFENNLKTVLQRQQLAKQLISNASFLYEYIDDHSIDPNTHQSLSGIPTRIVVGTNTNLRRINQLTLSEGLTLNSVIRTAASQTRTPRTSSYKLLMLLDIILDGS